MLFNRQFFILFFLYAAATVGILLALRYGLHSPMWEQHGLATHATSEATAGMPSLEPKYDVLLGLVGIALMMSVTMRIISAAWYLLAKKSFRHFLFFAPILVGLGALFLIFFFRIPPAFMGWLSIRYGKIHIELSALVGFFLITLGTLAFSVAFDVFTTLVQLPHFLRFYFVQRSFKKRQRLAQHITHLLEQGYVARVPYFLEKFEKLEGTSDYQGLELKKEWAKKKGDRILFKTLSTQLLKVSQGSEHLRLLYDIFLFERGQGHFEACFSCAQEAYKLGCKAFWVHEAHISRLVQVKDWAQAHMWLKRIKKYKLLDEGDFNAFQAMLCTAQAMFLLEEGHIQEAHRCIAEALYLKRDFLPAWAIGARAYTQENQFGRAYSFLKEAWLAYKHPFVSEIYIELVQKQWYESMTHHRDSALDSEDKIFHDVMEWTALLENETNSDFKRERRLFTAALALTLGKPQQARRQLYPFVQTNQNHTTLHEVMCTQRVCLLMAHIEEKEKQWGQAIYWLHKAQEAPRDPCWCAPRGFAQKEWVPINPQTGFFGELVWKEPGA